MGVQIVNLLRAAKLLQIGRRGDHPLGGLRQLARPQRAVFQLTNPQRHVKAFGDQFHIAVVQYHVDGDFRVVPQEIRQDRRQVVDAKIRRNRNAQQSRRRRLHGGNQRIRFARIIQHAAGAVVIGQANLGG